jgi:zinc protease
MNNLCDWRRAVKIKDDIKKVTLEQLNTVFKKYINNIPWSYQGDPKKVNARCTLKKKHQRFLKKRKLFK